MDPGFDAGVPVVHQRVWFQMYRAALDFGVQVSSETVFNETGLMNVLVPLNVLSLAAGLRVLPRFQVSGSRFPLEKDF